MCVPDPPQVVLSLGSTLNAEGIKEGDDVYFECNIKANPKQHKITWYRNVSITVAPNCDRCFVLFCANEPRLSSRRSFLRVWGYPGLQFYGCLGSRPSCLISFRNVCVVPEINRLGRDSGKLELLEF